MVMQIKRMRDLKKKGVKEQTTVKMNDSNNLNIVQIVTDCTFGSYAEIKS